MFKASAGILGLIAAATTLAAALTGAAPAGAEVLIFHGSRAGQPTLDEGEGGGNPFASAFIDILARPSVTLSELPATIKELTARKSDGPQVADVPSDMAPRDWPLVPRAAGELRIALVMVVSDYSAIGQASLPGAKLDADRVAAALKSAGFEYMMVRDLDLPGMRRLLAAFKAKSAQYDAALIYTTGHGVEVADTIFLLPGDYPIKEGTTALRTRAVPLPDIAAAAQARRVNLVFYAGCRDNPWAEGRGLGRK